jgi:hypothetical protein
MLKAVLIIILLTACVLAQDKPKPDATKPEAAPAIPVAKEQAENLSQAVRVVQEKETELGLLRIGLNSLVVDTLRGMGLDPAIWTLKVKEGGGFEAVKKPQPNKEVKP